jgi:tetratricopeptide (TPR) repeat protein
MLLGSGLPGPAQGAETDCSRWLEVGREETQQAEAFRKSGNADALAEHLENARDAFAKAMAACPDSAKSSWSQVQSRLAYCQYKGGHFGDACDAYAELLKAEPNRRVDRALYADALEQNGHYKEAVAELQTLVTADPERSGTFYCNMAMIYALDLGDGAQAVETAKKGLESPGAGSCLQFAWGKGLAVCGVGMLDTSEPDRGLKLLEDAKVKFAALEDDPEYGQKARAEMTDIDQRIHGEQKRKAKEKR